MNYLPLALGLFLASFNGFSQTIVAPQPTNCIKANFTVERSDGWSTMLLKLTNDCKEPVNFQNSTIRFLNKTNLNRSFWLTDYEPLSYPIGDLKISSQAQSNGTFLATLNLQFPTQSWAKTILPANGSFVIRYGEAKANFIADSVQVFLDSPSIVGSVDLINSSAKPTNVLQNYALVNLTLNGQTISQVQVPWGGHQVVSGLAPGSYVISPQNLSDSSGILYQGSANPASVVVASGTTVSATISYKASQSTGGIKFSLQNLPQQLVGYSGQPIVSLKNSQNNSITTANLQWGTITAVNNLSTAVSYSFSTPAISFNGFNCVPNFNPTTLIAATSAPMVNLSYNCTQIVQEAVRVNVSGAPISLAFVNVQFRPATNQTPVVQKITLTNGAGSDLVQLTEGEIYTVSADQVNGYSVSYSPQPLTVRQGVSEAISYTINSSSGARIIGYLPGWKTPPSATAIANAGYTHILVAFGVFSTTAPGQIVPAFDTVSASYIRSLQEAGIKVSLSLGGALTSITGTTVNFHDALSLASSPNAFIQAFTTSLENLMTQYNFDGFDIDIEHGLKEGGTFTNPTGDIAALATIVNTMHNKHPNLLISLAPQIANIAATRDFTEVWGNYASLIMQSHQSLSWVGIQVYNSGCAYGIDQVCYDPTDTTSPNASVAFATDLLANWPAQTSSGQVTNFQPYISYLSPSQVVLGYPAPNSSGISDGSPAAVPSMIKRAFQCLRTAVAGSSSCGSYIPPKAYQGLGGVFEWEITYDADNNFNFAKSLNACVKNGNCS